MVLKYYCFRENHNGSMQRGGENMGVGAIRQAYLELLNEVLAVAQM